MTGIKKALWVVTAMTVIGGTALPISENAQPVFGVTASAEEALSAPENLRYSAKGNTVTLEWDKVKGADGYRIYKYDAASKKYVKLKTVTANKAVISDLSAGKHYFKAAAVKKSGKSYTAGKSSDKLTVEIKETSKSPTSKKPESSKKASTASVELARKMGNGWNLGNTMESWATWLGSGAKARDYERAWGQPTTKKEMMTGLKKAGFDSVRIPVAWSNMMSKDGKYTISENYFDRVDEIIGYVLDSDMYCIINIHWDGGWWEDFGSADKAVQDAAMEKYKAMWKQIAEHYSGCSDKLIFESANEELGSSTRGKSSLDESYERVNLINQTFVDTVRASGGNNKNRFLLIAGYDTGIPSTIDKRFKMPSDTAKERLMISVHYYSPSTFCIADNVNNSWGYKGSWGTEADIGNMRKELAKMKKFTDAGYGVVIGEYGVSHEKNGSSYKVKKGTDLFFANMTAISREMGYCPMLWDCNDWYDRNACAFKDPVFGDIYKR